MYGKNHIQFLQTMLYTGCLEMDRVKLLYHKLGSESGNLNIFINEINEKINHESLKLLMAHCEVTDKEYVVLINTTDDDLTTLQLHYTPAELEYFYLILHELVYSEDKRLKQMFCLNLSSSLPTKSKVTVSHAQQMLTRWQEQGYLVQDDLFIYLGPRGLWEFMPYMQTKYQELCTMCNLCSELVMFGDSCGVCHEVFHKRCLSVFLNNTEGCPVCKSDMIAEEGNMS